MAGRGDSGDIKQDTKLIPQENKPSFPHGRSGIVTFEAIKKNNVVKEGHSAVQKGLNARGKPYNIRTSKMLVSAAREGLSALVEICLSENADINYADQETGFTALHYAAAREAKSLLKVLIKQSGLDYLVKDKKGRLPSTLAFEVAENPVIGTFLMKKEMQQAKWRGIDYRALLVGEVNA